MSTEENLTNAAQVPEIDNMKVPEIKKRLKSLGLSTVGNKAELVERLQEAYLGEKEGSLDGGLDDESLEEALLNDDADQNTTTETSLLGGEEFSFSSPEKEIQKIQSASTKPLKKRAVAQIPEQSPVEPAKPPAKIVLKRNNYPIIEAPKTDEIKKDRPLIEPPKSDAAVTTAEAKKIASLPETERLQMRAKRFNITDTKPKVAAVAPIQASGTLNTTNLEILRKRAERFGENVSTVMKKLENQEKLLKRKMKFVDSDSSSIKSVSSDGNSLTAEQEKKKKRLERFGLLK